MSKNNFMTLNVRVCGTETLNLVNSAKRTFVMGQEAGDVSSMSDSTRYHSLTEADFSQYY